MIEKRIVFLGTPEISADLLKGMVEQGFHIVGVVTKEDKVRGRNNKIEESPVAKMARELNIPVHKPHRLNKDFDFIKALEPDLLLTFAYGQLISDEVLALSKEKPLNVHASLLPKYRGAAPIQYALREGEEKTGVSLMEMVHEMDAGDVYAVKELTINMEDNYTSLASRLSSLALSLVTESLPLYFEHRLVGVKQDPTKVTFCPSIKKEEEHLNLSLAPQDFVNQVRSLSLTPGGYLLEGEQILKVYQACVYSDEVTAEKGTIVLAKKKQIILQLENGQVALEMLQRPGKKIMSAQDFNNGVRNFEGTILK